MVAKKTQKKRQQQSGGKRKLSGYMKFVKTMRSRVLRDKPSLTFPEVGKELGKRWRALSSGEKKKFA
jgi:hypothetical protein